MFRLLLVLGTRSAFGEDSVDASGLLQLQKVAAMRRDIQQHNSTGGQCCVRTPTGCDHELAECKGSDCNPNTDWFRDDVFGSLDPAKCGNARESIYRKHCGRNDVILEWSDSGVCPSPSLETGKCFVRMPTGCDRDLVECNTKWSPACNPKVWFTDRVYGSSNPDQCGGARLAAYNNHCGRTDAVLQWSPTGNPPSACCVRTPTGCDHELAECKGSDCNPTTDWFHDDVFGSLDPAKCGNARESIYRKHCGRNDAILEWSDSGVCPSPSSNNGKCFVRMPSGCDRDLVECNTKWSPACDPTEWFPDRVYGSKNPDECGGARLHAYNNHCGRTDAVLQWSATGDAPDDIFVSLRPDDECPDGTSAIENANECWQLADNGKIKSADGQVTGQWHSEVTKERRPTGCYLDHDGSVHFNKHATGKKNKWSVVVCKK